MADKIKFTADTGEEVEFFVIEETRVNNINYILVTEDEANDESEEAEAYILKDLSKDSDSEALYEFVDDDNELEAVSQMFAEILDDMDIDK
ncbi:MAG: DUF1292 domain-containing protein [Clostridiales bacterium]|mgnify:FL=1|nr:DUF1292 domain-containing protein [Clostridiales bacterium]